MQRLKWRLNRGNILNVAKPFLFVNKLTGITPVTLKIKDESVKVKTTPFDMIMYLLNLGFTGFLAYDFINEGNIFRKSGSNIMDHGFQVISGCYICFLGVGFLMKFYYRKEICLIMKRLYDFDNKVKLK